MIDSTPRLADRKKAMHILCVVSVLICTSGTLPAQPKDFTDFVNPFIGTDRMGHTFPGVSGCQMGHPRR